MKTKRANGEGSIYQRKDGRWVASVYAFTSGGHYKRISRYAKTQALAQACLAELSGQIHSSLPIPDKQVKLSAYLDYWLENFVKTNLRPKTYEQYEGAVRNYLRPGLGDSTIANLTVPRVQTFLNAQLRAGCSIRTVQVVRTTLSAALTRAMREELLTRNVARLVELPQWYRKDIQPWTESEAKQFLRAAKHHRLYPAFLLLVLYGMRRGEVLGLRWGDIDFEHNELHVRQQLLRVGRQLLQTPVKTKAGERTLPLMHSVKEALLAHKDVVARERLFKGPEVPRAIQDGELVFQTSNDTPIEPRNFVRSYWRICKAHDVRVIKLHHIRHTAATLLKDTGTPARDAQLILGHASAWTTTQIYQHDSIETRRQELGRLADSLHLGDNDKDEAGT